MKRLLLTLVSALLVPTLLLGGTAFAQGEEELQLPDPGITPDSPFYFLDSLGENIGLMFAFGPEAKAEKAIKYAQERLAEAEAMASANKTKGLEKATGKYNKYIALAAEKADELRQKDVTENLTEKVALAISKHLSVLDRIRDKAPEQAEEAIWLAHDASMNGLESALKGLATEKPDRATGINLATIDAKLRRADSKSQNDADEAENALDDAEKLFGFGDEIRDIARGLGKDTTTLDQLVARASAAHLEVLSIVYQKIPEHAKPHIEAVMTRTVRNRQSAFESLETEGASEEIPAAPPVPNNLPQAVKDRLKNIKPESRRPLD